MGRNHLVLLSLAIALSLALQTNARKIPTDEVKVSTNQKEAHEQAMTDDQKNIVFSGVGGYAGLGGVSLGGLPILGGGAGTFGGVGTITGSGLGPLGGLGGGGGAGGLLP